MPPSSPTNRRSARRLPDSSENPFCFRVHWTSARYLQVCIGAVTLLPIRIILALCIILPGIVLAKLVSLTLPVSAEGFSYHKPWQRYMMKVILGRCLGRGLLWCLGFPWIREYGTQADVSEAPVVVVCPHTSIFDSFFVGSIVHGAYVSLKSNRNFPLVKDLLEAAVTIWIDEKKKDDAVVEFQKRLKSTEKSPPIIFFPEGAVHGPGVLTEFKQELPLRLYTVSDLLLKARSSLNCQSSPSSFDSPKTAEGLFQTMCIAYTPAEVHFLPVYTPSEKEEQDPQLYATNVRNAISQQMKLNLSQHSRQDMILTSLAVKYGLPAWTGNVEYVVMRDTLHLNLDLLKVLLERFAVLDSDKDGFVTSEDFAADLNWPVAEDVAELFRTCDTAERGKITFREYAVAYSDLIRPYEEDAAFISQTFEALNRSNADAKTGRTSVEDQRLLSVSTWLMGLVANGRARERTNSAETSSTPNRNGTSTDIIDNFKQIVSRKPELLVLLSSLSSVSMES
ncbi:lysophosphatidylcholine acyltransferase 2-like isoform X1 [Sycon ciliatum]|uniref:lysophosphatidylcholine acyltransferase 2-like isoform X1 n=1 Tax=Sycon ciliatum TaxID=27933 RepID=UPI0031F71AEF